jgi:hypothetical protein
MTDQHANGKDSKPWFGNKRYGVGLRPQTWQGWSITAAFAVVMVVVVFLLRH